MLPVPQGLLLDYGDTVLTVLGFEPARGRDAILTDADIPSDVDVAQIDSLWELVYPVVRAAREESSIEATFEGLLRLVYEPLGIRFKWPYRELASRFWDAATDTEPTAGLEPLLDAAAAASVPVAIVSNSMFPAETIVEALARHQLEKRFRFVMSSADYALKKPHPLFMQAAAVRLGVPVQRIWFAGDKPSTDIKGANRVGMVSIHYDSVGRDPDPADPEQVADLRITQWSELVGRLRGE